MAGIIRCKNQIGNLYENDPSLQYRFSDFTHQAWGENKAECLEEFGSVAAIKSFLLNPGSFEFTQEEHNVADEDVENIGSTQESTNGEVGDLQAVQEQDGGFLAGVFEGDTMQERGMELLGFIGWGLLGIFVIIAAWKLIEYLLVLMYDVFNAGRVEYFTVVFPRGDSKSDRERQKELAKDMKEKISRMSQVYSNLHKLGELTVMDNVMRKIFDKPKVTFMLHYEKGKIQFIVGTYPEYRRIVESAIVAQYADASIQTVKKPDPFKKKNYELMPLHSEKEGLYPIRLFNQMTDDPLNNVIDAIAKVDNDDTFTMVMTTRPERSSFNKKAQRLAEGLYKKDKSITDRKNWFQKLLPWNFFKFLAHGPSEKLIKKYSSTNSSGDPIVRMVKAEEEALNTMGEEAGKKAFKAGLMLISSSDSDKKARQNIYNLVSAYTVYSDEYNNSLDQPELVSDMLGGIVEPIWKLSYSFLLPSFFFQHNIFTVNELTSLYHFPDTMYNRSPSISWMNYKTLPAPDKLAVLKDENEDFMISGIVPDSYRGGKVSEIIRDMDDPSVGIKEEVTEKKIPLPKNYTPKESDSVVTKDGKEYLVKKSVKKIPALKTYTDGVLVGLNVYRNKYSPIYMKKKDRTKHHYIIGKSGTGKSVYISLLARQDIWNGSGMCVVDPHGDLVKDVMAYVPKHRAKDVIYFDAGNEERPMGLNLYEIENMGEADRAVNDAVEIFLKMFGPEIFGPRIQEYFKYGSLTLLEDMEEGATLIDVPRLFTDEGYRNYKVGKVKNPVVKNFWEHTYNAMGEREKQEIIPYFTSKFVSFITNSLIRNIIGQTESAFNFRKVMDEGKILLINLSKGDIGELNAKLLGMILVSKIYNAAMSRADMDEEERKYFYLYVDEFQNFVTDTFADILSEARKYKLCLIMAHQYIAQLEDNAGNNIGEGKSGKVKDAVFGNVGTMQSFKVGAPDAEFLEKEYAPDLGPQDIIGISNYKAYMKLNINNTTSRVFSINSIYSQEYKSERVADILAEYSGKKYGRKKEFVDAEIAARLGMLGDKDDVDPEDLEEGESLIPDDVGEKMKEKAMKDIAKKKEKESEEKVKQNQKKNSSSKGAEEETSSKQSKDNQDNK